MISVVAICRNEEKNVQGFLASWSEVADEIVILDTGSDDNTVKLLAEHELSNPKLRVHHYAWRNDFSAARNHAASLASGNWILWADMDDRMHRPSIHDVRQFANGEPRILVFQVASDVGNGCWHRFLQARMYPARTSVQFEGAVHESIEKSAARCGLQFDVQDCVVIAHLGYNDPEVKRRKAVRNLDILMNDDRCHEDANKLMQIGDSLYVLGKYFVGLGYYEEAIRVGGEQYRTMLAEKLCNGYLAVGCFEKLYDTLRNMNPYSVEYYFWYAQGLLYEGNKETALRFFKMVESSERSNFMLREDNSDALIAAAKEAIKKLEGECAPA